MNKEVSEAHGGSSNTETIKQVTYKGRLNREGRSKGWGIKMGDSKNKSYAHIHTHENVTPSITLYAKNI